MTSSDPAFETASVLVLHEPGDPDGGAPWRDALLGAGCAGAVLAPDLPGHGTTPAPVGGAYEPIDPALFVLPLLERGSVTSPPVVVGVGASGWAASLLALGGRSSALVLIDGLGGPWTDARGSVEASRRWLRAVAADRAATALPPPPAPGALDPRLAHSAPPQGNRALAERAARATTVPALLARSSRSPLSAIEVAELASCFGAGASTVEVADRSPAAVADVVVAWSSARGRAG